MGAAVRDLFRVTGAVAAFVVQTFVLFAFTDGWVASANIAEGNCGPDGTCTENGLGGALGTVELTAIGAELLLGTLWWAWPLLRKRTTLGVDEWWDLVALRLPRTFIAGGLLSLLAMVAWRVFR